MTQTDEEIVRRGILKGVAYSRAKKYACRKGELILTTKNLFINCEGSWSKAFPIGEIRLEAWDNTLELREIWYGRLLFKLIVNEPDEWEETFTIVINKMLYEDWKGLWERAEKSQEELEKFLDLNPETLKKLYDYTHKEREQFERKNIRFNLDIQSLLKGVKSRKLKAFMVAHSYVAWYEWTKRLLYKIFKAKFGKGPINDNELMKFLDDYPLLKGSLSTAEWGIQANQIRNCVCHEKFFFDYKSSELVFMVGEEKRVRLRDLRIKIYPMANFYIKLITSLKEKVELRKK